MDRTKSRSDIQFDKIKKNSANQQGCRHQSGAVESGSQGFGPRLQFCCCCCQVASVVSVQPIDGSPPGSPWDSPGKNTGVGCHVLLRCMKVKSESEVAQSCPTLSDPMDCSPPGSSVHGVFQARVLEWGAIAFSGLEF